MMCARRLCIAVALSCLFGAAVQTSLADPRAAWKTPADAVIHRDVIFAEPDGHPLALDLYLPANPEHRPPLLVWIHGGGWRGGDKLEFPLKYLVAEGYAVASIRYRLSDVAKWPAQIHDCKAAIRWLRAKQGQYGYDATKVGISGASAGGHLVALLGTTAGMAELEGEVGGHLSQSSRVQAVVNYFGPTDFTTLVEQHHPEFTTSLVALLIGGPIMSNAKLAKQASPVNHVSADDAPMLIIQGTKDPLIYLPQSEQIYDVYRKTDLPVHLEVIVGGGHGGPEFWDAKRRAMIHRFFDKHVRGH